jgi:predicted regulator of Ras-like GTPase activity (Roadblock/LC7/MglB family)
VLIVIAKRSSNNLEVNAVSVTRHLHGLKSPMVISVDSLTVRNALSIHTPVEPVSAMSAVVYLV